MDRSRPLAAGDFRYRIPVKGNDELAELSGVFNRTAADLANLFEEVQRRRAAKQAAEAALHHRAQELAPANADLEQFAYSASHDVKEPLRIVGLYSQLLKRSYGGELDATADEYIEFAHRASRQMEQSRFLPIRFRACGLTRSMYSNCFTISLVTDASTRVPGSG